MRGVNAITDSIRVTIGPSGRTVIYTTPYSDPKATKDGYTVARETKMTDPVEEVGASIVRGASRETVNEAGDGTSTTAVLLQSMLKEGFDLVHSNINPNLLRKGMFDAAAMATQYINHHSKKIEKGDVQHLRSIARISSNGDDAIANLITEAVIAAGPQGQVVLENGRGGIDEVHTTVGSQYPRGFYNGHFVTNVERSSVEFENPDILIIQDRISNGNDIKKLIEGFLVDGTLAKPLLIIGQEFGESAIDALVQLRNGYDMPVAAALPPRFGNDITSILIDLSIMLGGKVIGRAHNVSFSDVKNYNTPNGNVVAGGADKIILTKHHQLYINGHGNPEDIEGRVNAIQGLIDNSETDYERHSLEARRAKFKGAISTIRVAGKTELEQNERRDRFDDALSAVRCAIDAGYVPGGGSMLIKAAHHCKLHLDAYEGGDVERKGFKLFCDALKEPTKQICKNAFYKESDLIIQKIRESEDGFGFNAVNGKIENLIESGVIDPARVLTSAIKNATSRAATTLTADVVMTHKDTWKK
tara:strand:- start:73086 stop:74675 length:1590 start_codon:yes stop_codon:yes gene_type:complete